jgi:hypothetical protein
MSSLDSSWAFGGASIQAKAPQNRFPAANAISWFHVDLCIHWEKNINARSKPDESNALAAGDLLSARDPRNNPSHPDPGNHPDGKVTSVPRSETNQQVFVAEARVAADGPRPASWEMLEQCNTPRNGRVLHMHIEQGQVNGDAAGRPVQKMCLGARVDVVDGSMRRRKNGGGLPWRPWVGVAEKAQDEGGAHKPGKAGGQGNLPLFRWNRGHREPSDNGKGESKECDDLQPIEDRSASMLSLHDVEVLSER